MGKPTGKKKDSVAEKPGNANAKISKHSDRNSKAFDDDTAIFISMAQELKEEGNKLFQKNDHEGAMLKYEKAVKLLPGNHIDVAHIRTNMAACYMQLGLGEYPRAIDECNLALESSPRYSKALLRRARCYEALKGFDFALRDVNLVLSMEPNNTSALEISERVRKTLAESGITVDEKEINLASLESPISRFRKVVKTKMKKKNKKSEEKAEEKVVVEKKLKQSEVHEVREVTKNTVEEEKLVVKLVKEEKSVSKTVKLVFGEDIRWAQLPPNCSLKLVREIVRDRFPGLQGFLVKYRDREGDLVTITNTDELRLAESLFKLRGSIRLYISEVSPDQEPIYEGIETEKEAVSKDDVEPSNVFENGDIEKGTEVGKGFISVEDWIVHFARLFKNHVGIDSDSYLDFHELGMKLYSEAMEETVTSDDAQELFEIAADKFQEMAALAMFNWGNIHMSRARKRIVFSEDASRDFIIEQIKSTFEWAQKEYKKAESRYEESLKIKPDFYEGYLALGQQQFEEAKLCWYYLTGGETDLGLESGPSSEVLQLYNKAEDCMEKGMMMWEELEEQRLNGLSKVEKYKIELQKIGLDGLIQDVSPDEADEQAANMKSQIYLLWGTLLYERSAVEYKLELPTWEECLEVAVEKFELAGASPTDVAVMIKNHCSNETALEGLGFKIDEIVQAWNEMYDANRWQFEVPSFRLEPLFRRRVPKLHSTMDHF